MSFRILNNLALLAILTGLPGSASLIAPCTAKDGTPAIHFSARQYSDMSKMRIEKPVKGLIGNFRGSIASDLFKSNQPRMKPLEAKRVDVGAVDKHWLPKQPAISAKVSRSAQKTTVKQQPSEKVEPGKVRWHKAIQTAMDASRQSGKPVLLFQMMGRLDDRFC